MQQRGVYDGDAVVVEEQLVDGGAEVGVEGRIGKGDCTRFGSGTVVGVGHVGG